MRQQPAKRRRSSTGPRRDVRHTADLSALSKKQLLALVSELQAKDKGDGQVSGEAAPGEAPKTEAPAPTAGSKAPCLFIDGSVRSGQVVEFPTGDVTVIGSVGSGAEIVAGGSIHIYGTLRGRVLAGTAGDPEARILCQCFQAELLAIDGRYRLAENLDPKLRGRAVQARLEGTGMTVSPLD